jgi:hypothetical protein
MLVCQFRAETRVDRLLAASPDVEVVSNSEADETEYDCTGGSPPELRENAEERAESGINAEVSY